MEDSPSQNDYWHKRQLSLGIICKTESEIQKPFSFFLVFFHNRCLAFYDNASQLVLQ